MLLTRSLDFPLAADSPARATAPRGGGCNATLSFLFRLMFLLLVSGIFFPLPSSNKVQTFSDVTHLLVQGRRRRRTLQERRRRDENKQLQDRCHHVGPPRESAARQAGRQRQPARVAPTRAAGRTDGDCAGRKVGPTQGAAEWLFFIYMYTYKADPSHWTHTPPEVCWTFAASTPPVHLPKVR